MGRSLSSLHRQVKTYMGIDSICERRAWMCKPNQGDVHSARLMTTNKHMAWICIHAIAGRLLVYKILVGHPLHDAHAHIPAALKSCCRLFLDTA